MKALNRETRAVKVGGVIIGGGFPVSVQTMWKSRLTETGLPEVSEALEKLKKIGCDLVRFAVPDDVAAELLGRLCGMTAMPLIADIHFDYRLALRCLDFPIAKIRINPGTIGEEWKVREIAEKAKGQGVPLRVGVNTGSLPRKLESRKDQARALVEAAELEMELLDRLGFGDVIFSLKSSDVDTMVRANTLFSKKYDFPLHIGVTEAGPLIPGIVKNALGIAILLRKGVGDTIRVSLSSSPENEVLTGLEILRAVKLRKGGIEVVSCPRCGRSSFDVQTFLEDVSDFIHSIRKPLTIAVMGCPVNGPGEAKKTDIGITGAGNYAIIFRAGKIVRRVPLNEAVEHFKREVEELCKER